MTGSGLSVRPRARSPAQRRTVTAPARAGPRRGPILAVLCVSLLIVSLDNTILNVALPSMVRSLQATSSQLQWIVDAYAVVFGGLLLAMGSLGDRRGRKPVFLAGLVVFAAGSVAAAFAGTPNRLIAARGFMGVGAAAIMPSTLSILTNVFTRGEDRARAIGIWSGTTGLGVALGPMVGGWLLSHYWWGSVFLVNVPIVLAGLLAALWLVPNSKDPRPRPADVPGTLLSVAGMTLLLWAIIDAPNRGWGSPVVLVPMAAAAVVLGSFVIWERRSDHPMLPVAFFRSRRFAAAIGAMALVSFALMGALFMLTQYLQFALGYSALQAGVRVAPIAAVLLVVAPASTMIVRRVGTKLVVFGGLVLVALSLALLARVTAADTYADVVGRFFMLGIGVGLTFAPCTDSVMGSVPAARAGVASATNGTALQTGGALGVAVLGSLLSGRYQADLAPVLGRYPVPKSALHVINGSLGGAQEVAHRVGGSVGAVLSAVARSSFLSGMGLAMRVGAVVVGAAAVAVVAVLPARPDPGNPAEA